MAELRHRGGQGVGAPVEQPAGGAVAAGGADGGGNQRGFRGWWTTIAMVAAVVAVVVAAGWRSSGGGGASGGVVGAEWSAQDAWAAQLESLRRELRAEQQRFGEVEAALKRSQSELEALRSDMAAKKDVDASLAVAERVARMPAVWTEQIRLAGHTGRVAVLVAHPTRPLLFSGAFDGDTDIRVWDLSSRSLRSLKGHANVVFGLALDPTGTRLASGSHDHTVRIWDFETGFCSTMTGHSNHVWSVVWSASGSLVASGSWDATVRVWEAATGALKHTLTGHTAPIDALASHPTEDLLASGSHDHTIRLWRWSSGERVRTLKGHSHMVLSLVASSSFLVSGSFDKSVRVWSWTAEAPVYTLDGVVHPLWENALAWRNNTLVTLEGPDWQKPEATVRVWDTSAAHPKDWVHLGSLPSTVSSPYGVAVLSDGRVACGGTGDRKTIGVWGV